MIKVVLEIHSMYFENPTHFYKRIGGQGFCYEATKHFWVSVLATKKLPCIISCIKKNNKHNFYDIVGS